MGKISNKQIYFIFFFLSIIVYSPILYNINNLGINDFDYNFFQINVALESIFKFKEFPLWNPYDQGGVPLLGTSFSRVLNPFMVLYFIFPAIIALKFEIILMVFLGQIGTYKFLSHKELSRAGAFVGSTLFAFSSYYSLNITQGHHEFIPALLVPFVFYFNEKKGLEKIIGMSLTLTWMFFGGAVYIIVITMTSILFMTILGSIKKRSWRTFIDLIKVIVLFVGLSAIKLFPSVVYMSKYPRVIHDFSGWSISSMIHSFVNPGQWITPTTNMEVFYERIADLVGLSNSTSVLTGIDHGWDENGLYLGVGFFIMLFIGFVKKVLDNPRSIYHFVFCMNFLICFGDRLSFGPWKLMKLFPLFESMRHSQRFRVIVLFLSCYYIGSLTSYLFLKMKSSKLATNTLVFFLSFSLLSVFYVSHSIVKDAFPFKGFSKIERKKQLSFVGKWQKNDKYYTFSEVGFYPAFLENHGIAYDKENQTVPLGVKTIFQENYVGEISPDSSTIVKETNNTKIIRNIAESTSLNRNYMFGWTSDHCQLNEKVNNLNLYNCPEGKEVSLRYWPKSFTVGLIMSVLSLLFMVLIFLRKRSQLIK
ncbi:hypothetical protein OAT67_02090 [Bacteriovoracaceae bacterium]|nr:hypothetical protein [Bacteriovoracaceae bacterium]